VGAVTHGRRISQPLEDSKDVWPTISRGGLIFQGQGNEFVVTLARQGRLKGGRKAREDLHPMICIRYCWVILPAPQPRRANVVWRVEGDDPDRRVWKFARDAYPMRPLRGIDVGPIYADGQSPPETRPAYVLHRAPAAEFVLVAPPDLRGEFLERFCESRLA